MAAQKNASNINFQQTVENKKDTKKRSIEFFGIRFSISVPQGNS